MLWQLISRNDLRGIFWHALASDVKSWPDVHISTTSVTWAQSMTWCANTLINFNPMPAPDLVTRHSYSFFLKMNSWVDSVSGNILGHCCEQGLLMCMNMISMVWSSDFDSLHHLIPQYHLGGRFRRNVASIAKNIRHVVCRMMKALVNALKVTWLVHVHDSWTVKMVCVGRHLMSKIDLLNSFGHIVESEVQKEANSHIWDICGSSCGNSTWCG